jgi:hypothetical protein
MKHLIEISRIVTKRKVRKIEIFDEHSLRNKKSKFNEFYEGLRSNKFKNDRDAANKLYGCGPTDAKYRQLKSRFKKRLLNTLFFLDVNIPSASNYDRAHYSCNKDWALVKTLVWYGAPHTAAHLARQILTTALKFQFADIILLCARILRSYSAENSDERRYEEYDNYIKQYTHVLDAEIRSEEFYQRVIMNYFKPVSKNKELSEQISFYCDALVSLSEQYPSPVVFYNMYLVWIFRFEMMQDFEAMLEVCDRGEQYIEQNPTFKQENKLAIFQSKKMSAYLHLKNYRDGRSNAEKSLNTHTAGSQIWFLFMEYYFLLAMHTENYIHAVAIFKRAVEHNKFKKLDGDQKEKWNIFEGFINYIVENEGRNNPVLRAHQPSSFKVNKLLNSKPSYSRGQVIFAVLNLILQMLFLLERKSFNGVTDRIDLLKKYSTRLARKEEYNRTVQFIRLLQQLSKVDYQLEELSGTQKYMKALEQNPFFYRGVPSELEVIPYEMLWQRIISYLQ